MKTRWTMMLAALLLAGCNDTLTDDILSTADSDGDLLFSVSTLEQADMTIGVGTTRALGDSAMRLSDTFVAHQLTGSNPDGLTIHRMPLPYMGIHHGTVTARSLFSDTVTASSTRAHKDAIVTTALNNFHDSLTIWGYTSHPYKTTGANDAANSTIFYQTLLKRIRNWRSSAHWPYGGDKMKFYALAPSMENINVIEGGTPSFSTPPTMPSFSTPPTITYTLPEKAAEMRDLLWGESDVVDVEAGPAGTPLYPSANTPREQHLGQDDKMVDMTFQHILTAIRFAQGNIPTGSTIKKITLHNVYTRGTFSPASTDAATGTKGAWSNTEAKADYSIWPNTTGSGTTANTYIDHDSLFFMIPHTVTDAELQVTIEVKPRYKVDANGVYQKDGAGNYIPSDSNTPAIAHTLKCSLAGDVWKKGYTVTYKLTVGEVADGYYLIAENPAEAEHSTSPTDGSFAVHSYRSYYDYATNTEVTTHGVEWVVEGYYSDEECTTPSVGSDATTPPVWFTTAPQGSTGTTGFVGGYAATANYTIKAQEKTKSANHETILEENSKAQASSLDLSQYTPNKIYLGSIITANCYIVNREGTYKLPMYYGNGNVGSSIFTDHQGKTITSSNIKSQILGKNGEYVGDNYDDVTTEGENKYGTRTGYEWSTTGLRNVIVWQDVDGLVTSPSIISSDNGYMEFSVHKSTPGNALIALQGRQVKRYYKKIGSSSWEVDNSKGTGGYDYVGDWETFWTWHIWMTDEVYPNDRKYNEVYDDSQFLNYNSDHRDHIVSITNKADPAVSTTILPVNLGWVPDEMDFGYYSKRECWVKLRQVAPMTGEDVTANQSCVVHIVQHAKQDLITGTSTVYQWGRPTALPAVCHINKTPRNIYLGSEFNSSTFTLENVVEAGDIITKPTKLLRQPYGLSWFSTSGSIPAYWGSTKTVYDPCPPGFQLPAYSIFSGFSLTGATADDGTSLNIWQDAAEHGRGAYFYTTPHTTTIPATDRYSQTVYMPATGQYQGNKEVGTPLNTTSGDNAIFIDANAGMVWSYDVSGTQGASLWYYPEWNYTKTNDKPAIALPRPVNFSTAMPIRPAGNIPGN